MTTYLHDLIPADALAEALDQKLVSRKTSADGSLELYVYSTDAQFQNAWNVATINARGLVVDAKTHEVVARPFQKFFNYGSQDAPTLTPDLRVEATDKLDGSLGILLPGGHIASKGSFQSSVAVHATKVYKERYHGAWSPRDGITYLFEIIHPNGRIVLDYGRTDDLFLLGAVDNSSGEVYGPNSEETAAWPGPRTSVLPFTTVGDALAAPPRENAEGLVLRVLDTGEQVKLKQEDYLHLHAIVTNTSPRNIWEAMAVNDLRRFDLSTKDYVRLLRVGPVRVERALNLGENWLTKLSETTPDEFHDWLQATQAEILEDYKAMEHKVLRAAGEVSTWGTLPKKELVAKLREQQYDGFNWQTVLEVHGHGGLTARAASTLWLEVTPPAGGLGWMTGPE